MPNYSKIQIIGHAGRDAELKTVGDNKVASFSVAVKGYKGETTWFDVSVWDKTAENYVGPFLKKGNAVFVNGEPKLETFQKKDGTHGAKISIRADQVQIMGGDKAEHGDTKPDAQAPLPSKPAPVSVSSLDDSEIPFMAYQAFILA